MTKRFLLILAAFVLWSSSCCASSASFARPTEEPKDYYVNDFEQVLTHAQREALNECLYAFLDETGVALAVFTQGDLLSIANEDEMQMFSDAFRSLFQAEDLMIYVVDFKAQTHWLTPYGEKLSAMNIPQKEYDKVVGECGSLLAEQKYNEAFLCAADMLREIIFKYASP